jgi:hypothetical protein
MKESNWEEVDAAVLAVEKEVNRIGQMKTWTETIRIRQSNAPCFTAGFGDALDS